MGLAKKYQPPPRTGMDVFRMLPEGTLAELLNNIVYISPSPNRTHQEISIELSAKIWMHVKKSKTGRCYEAPMDVYFNNKMQYSLIFLLFCPVIR